MNLNELFNSGMDFNTFIETENGQYKEKSLALLNAINVSDDAATKISNIETNINILVFAEIWCPDCVLNVPAVEKLNQLSDKINISIIKREGNEDKMAPYLVDGKAKIPTFIVFDENFNELGSFIEKPSNVLEAEHSGDQVKNIVAKKNYRNGEFVDVSFQDIVNIF